MKQWNIFFKISGPGGTITAPNTGNPIEANSLSALLKGMADDVPDKIAGGMAEVTGVTIELALPTLPPLQADDNKPEHKPDQPDLTFNSHSSASADWEDAIEQCNKILSMCEDVPERGEDFAMSVSEKVQGISETIEEMEFVTEPQQESLDNMQAGVSRWIK